MTYISENFNVTKTGYYNKFLFLQIDENNETLRTNYLLRFPHISHEVAEVLSKICLENITPAINYINSKPFTYSKISKYNISSIKIGDMYVIVEPKQKPRSSGEEKSESLILKLHRFFIFVFIISLATTIVLFKKFRNRKRLLRLSLAILLFSIFNLISKYCGGIGFPIEFYYEISALNCLASNDGIPCGVTIFRPQLYFSIIVLFLDIFFFYALVYFIEKVWFGIKKTWMKILTIAPLIYILFIFSNSCPRLSFYILGFWEKLLIIVYITWLIILLCKYYLSRKIKPWLIYSVIFTWSLLSIYILLGEKIKFLIFLILPFLFINPLFYLFIYLFPYGVNAPGLELVILILILFTSSIMICFAIHKIKQLLRKIKEK